MIGAVFHVRRRLVVLGAVLALVLGCLIVLLVAGDDHRPPVAKRMRGTSTAPAASTTRPRSAVVTAALPSPPPTRAPFVRLMPRTSADVYAAAVAEALWNIDYAATDRAAVLAFWKGQLATTLPAGAPSGTTLAQAQDAAMSTLSEYLPSAAMWATLARDHTVSSFTVTGVSEPPSWVAAVADGEIADPGLTARTVVGVQKLSYAADGATRTTAQTQQLTVAMLCPPTTAWCSLEIIPPRGETDTP
jgi:hypothetical protein